jgi:hypothetical protein
VVVVVVVCLVRFGCWFRFIGIVVYVPKVESGGGQRMVCFVVVHALSFENLASFGLDAIRNL